MVDFYKSLLLISIESQCSAPSLIRKQQIKTITPWARTFYFIRERVYDTGILSALTAQMCCIITIYLPSSLNHPAVSLNRRVSQRGALFLFNHPTDRKCHLYKMSKLSLSSLFSLVTLNYSVTFPPTQGHRGLRHCRSGHTIPVPIWRETRISIPLL